MAQDKELGYDSETEALVQRMCKYVERSDFELNDEAATESIMKTYDLFDLPRPKRIVWLKDIFDKQFEDAARSAWSAWSAWSARSAWSAWSAGSARSAWSAWSAGSARSAWSAWSAGSARSAWSAWSAGSAWSAWSAGSARSAWSAGSAWSAWSAWSAGWTALDEDFWYYVFSYEYVRNPDSQYPPNSNDEKYLAYSELLLQALEYGAGYRVEWEDTLYIAPTPLVRIDSQSRFHSDEGPAIRWKDGWEGYYLYGEHFDEKLWRRITSDSFTAKELMEIQDTDKRSIAQTYLVPGDMIKQFNAKFVHQGIRGNKLYRCDNYLDSGKTEHLLWMRDASTDREFIHAVPKDFDYHNNADKATAGMFRTGDGRMMPLEDYLGLTYEA